MLIKVDDMLTLCYLYKNGNIEEFGQDLQLLFYHQSSVQKTLDKLEKLSEGERFLFPSAAKTFYEKYKVMIDIVLENNALAFLLKLQPKNVKKENIDNQVNYIKNHLKDLDKIINILNHLKKLNFPYFSLSESSNFDNREATISRFFLDNDAIKYWDNREIVPEYKSDRITYRTTESPYEIQVEFVGGHILQQNISLNSLIFDANRLPEAINRSIFFDELVSLANELKPEIESATDLVNFENNLGNLGNIVSDLYEYVQKQMRSTDSDKAKTFLKNMQKNIDQIDVHWNKINNIYSDYKHATEKKESSKTRKLTTKK